MASGDEFKNKEKSVYGLGKEKVTQYQTGCVRSLIGIVGIVFDFCCG